MFLRYERVSNRDWKLFKIIIASKGRVGCKGRRREKGNLRKRDTYNSMGGLNGQALHFVHSLL